MAKRYTATDVYNLLNNYIIEKEADFRDLHEMKSSFVGNGKPGWNAIRDKVLSWEIKSNALLLLVVGDIIVRLVQP